MNRLVKSLQMRLKQVSSQSHLLMPCKYCIRAAHHNHVLKLSVPAHTHSGPLLLRSLAQVVAGNPTLTDKVSDHTRQTNRIDQVTMSINRSIVSLPLLILMNQDETLQALEKEVQGLQSAYANAIAQTRSQGMAMVTKSMELEQALDTFLFACLSHHAADWDGEEIGRRLAKVVTAQVTPESDGLIYAWSWEARLRSWLRRLLCQEESQAAAVLADVMSRLDQGGGKDVDKRVSKIILAIKSCLSLVKSSSASVEELKEKDVGIMLRSIPCVCLNVAPKPSKLVDVVERIEVYDAGLDQG